MTLKELVMKNRSYRGYDESYHFTREQLMELVDFTRFTASSVNVQPLKYHVAWEHDEVEMILSMTKWAAALPDMTLPHPGKHPTAFVVIAIDTKIGPNIGKFQKDVGIAAQTLLLAAVEQGLGGIMIGNFKPEEVAGKLNFPENLVPVLLVALGKPDETIVIKEAEEGQSLIYYRDENDVHYVPKRKLEDICF